MSVPPSSEGSDIDHRNFNHPSGNNYRAPQIEHQPSPFSRWTRTRTDSIHAMNPNSAKMSHSSDSNNNYSRTDVSHHNRNATTAHHPSYLEALQNGGREAYETVGTAFGLTHNHNPFSSSYTTHHHPQSAAPGPRLLPPMRTPSDDMQHSYRRDAGVTGAIDPSLSRRGFDHFRGAHQAANAGGRLPRPVFA